jgi:hypothetical protein
VTAPDAFVTATGPFVVEAYALDVT